MFRMRQISRCVATVAFAGMSISAYSANYDPQEYSALLNLAANRQYVRVIIDLNIDIPLGAPEKQSAALKGKLTAKEAAVFAELGDSALKTGSWRNGLGQIGLYVTEDGLKRLTDNQNVRAFGIDPTGAMQTGVYEDDGRIARITSEIERQGYADVEVTLNLENLDFDIGRDAKVVHKPTTEQRIEVQSKLPALLASLPQRGVLNPIQVRSDIQSNNSTQTIRIDKEGLFALRENENVRALRLSSDDTNVTIFQIAPKVLEVAHQFGYAEVTVDLRRPSVYSPKEGRLPAKAWQAQIRAIRKAFADIFSQYGSDDVKLTQDYEGIASASFRLSANALEQIAQNPDSRLQKISLVETVSTTAITPIANPTLIRDSTRYVGMHNAWAKGYTGAGQSIMILDSGFETNHPFISGKVTFEACFGTPNGTVVPYIDSQGMQNWGQQFTMCLDANAATGDSPLGQAGSSANCSTSFDAGCYHGTHVAGIAAGKAGWNASLGWNSNRGLSGMATGASIIAVKVFSELRTFDGQHIGLRANDTDIKAALSALRNATPAVGGETTVNMSLGSFQGTTLEECRSRDAAFNDIVAQLHSLRIPVIASTGNDGRNDLLGWPACAPRVIKVAASLADQNGFPNYTNRINPASLPGAGGDPANGAELIVFAPGGSNSTDNPPTGIVSANLGGGAGADAGTSMAAPHVAGLYAAIKQAAPGISVASASSWVWAQAASTQLSTGTYNIRRINIPVLP